MSEQCSLDRVHERSISHPLRSGKMSGNSERLFRATASGWLCFCCSRRTVRDGGKGIDPAPTALLSSLHPHDTAGEPCQETGIIDLIKALCLWGWDTMAADGLMTLRSDFGPQDTMNRLEAGVRAAGLTVFAHVDHAGGAAAVGLPLRPTDLLIFGNAKGGTPLMQLDQTIGVDLPLKALVWQDASGITWLSYNDPIWLAGRHSLGSKADSTVSAMASALAALAKNATSAS
jgi:uncharacterized protein (DUF302 family)